MSTQHPPSWRPEDDPQQGSRWRVQPPAPDTDEPVPPGWVQQPPPGPTGYGQAQVPGQPGQPHQGQPHQGQPHPGQPYPGQPHSNQPQLGQPQPGQPYPGQPHPGQPYLSQPHPNQPQPGRPDPRPWTENADQRPWTADQRSAPGNPLQQPTGGYAHRAAPGRHGQGSGQPPAMGQPGTGQPGPAQPDTGQPGTAQPGTGQPGMAHGFGHAGAQIPQHPGPQHGGVAGPQHAGAPAPHAPGGWPQQANGGWSPQPRPGGAPGPQAWADPPNRGDGGAPHPGAWHADEDHADDEQDGDDWDGEGHGHAHGHGHGATAKVSAHTRRVVMAILVPCMIATLVGLVLLWPGKVTPAAGGGTGGDQRAYGTVNAVTESPCPPGPTPGLAGGSDLPCGVATVHITSGPGANTDVVVDLPQGPGSPTLAEGDKIVLAYTPAIPNQSGASYAVVDHQRGQTLVYMLALCGAIIVVFGRLRGFAAIIGLGLSFAVLLVFILPGILTGESPLGVAIIGSAAIMFATLYLTNGVNVHTSVAILGTLASLVVTGLLGAAFTAALKLTGFGSEETVYLSVLQGSVDMRGLLLAGIIIGALGVLGDMTITQALTVAELAPGAPSRMEVYRAGTRIGRAHVASAVNTIAMAYAGASLPLLLLIAVGGRKVSDLLTSEFLTQEIVRSAVGTVGLVAAVPITTALATLVADIRPRSAVGRRTRG